MLDPAVPLIVVIPLANVMGELPRVVVVEVVAVTIGTVFTVPVPVTVCAVALIAKATVQIAIATIFLSIISSPLHLGNLSDQLFASCILVLDYTM